MFLLSCWKSFKLHDLHSVIPKAPDREFLIRVSYMEIYNEVSDEIHNEAVGTNV